MKYLTMGMPDEALFLAFKSGIPQLLNVCKSFAKKKGQIMIENLIDHHEEKMNPGKSSCLIKAMT